MLLKDAVADGKWKRQKQDKIDKLIRKRKIGKETKLKVMK